MGTGFINTKLHWLAKCSGINLTHLSWADYTDAFLELLCSLLDNRWCRSLFSEPYILYRIVDDHFPISMVACNYMHDDCCWSVRHTKQEEFDYTGRRGNGPASLKTMDMVCSWHRNDTLLGWMPTTVPYKWCLKHIRPPPTRSVCCSFTVWRDANIF